MASNTDVDYQCILKLVLATNRTGPFQEVIGKIKLTGLDSSFLKLGTVFHSGAFRNEIFRIVNRFQDLVGLEHKQILFACPTLTTFHHILPVVDDMDKGFHGCPLDFIFSPYAQPLQIVKENKTIFRHRVLFSIFDGEYGERNGPRENHLGIIYNGTPQLFKRDLNSQTIFQLPSFPIIENFTSLRSLNEKPYVLCNDRIYRNFLRFTSLFDPVSDSFYSFHGNNLQHTMTFSIIGCSNCPFPLLNINYEPFHTP